MTSRGWTFTNFEINEGAYLKWFCGDKDERANTNISLPTPIRYIIFSLEQCPETGRLHHQGYLELNSPQRMAAVKKLLGVNSIHLERRWGKREEARNYCMKSDTHIRGPWELGDWEAGGQGSRNDIREVKNAIDEGKNENDIIEEFPNTYIKYSTGIRRVFENKEMEKKRNWKTNVTVYYGKTGTGKSYWANEYFPEAYWKDNTIWWNGYNGHDSIIIDDFRGSFDWDYLLTLLDRYPKLIQTKGGYKQFLARNIVITSSKHPSKWYENKKDDEISQLLRRIEQIIFFSGDSCHEELGNTKPSSEKEIDEMKNFFKK